MGQLENLNPLSFMIQSVQFKGLQIKGLSCFRDERVLFKNLSFNAEPGQIIVIAGENGSGKTSLLKIICHLLPPESGEVFYNGEVIDVLGPEYHQNLCYLGHAPAIKTDFTVLENVRFNTSLKEDVADELLVHAINDVGLKGFQHALAGHLSAGQKRRVALAKLAVERSPLWVLDEPLTALDVKGVAWVEGRLVAHICAGGIVVMTTHQPLQHVGLKPSIVHLDAVQI